MNNTIQEILEILEEMISDTFETLTFSEISSWQITKNWPDTQFPWIGASIDILQPVKCRITILLDRFQCRGFIDTAYGEEISTDSDIECFLNDYTCELVNTIAGRVAAEIARVDGGISLGLPQPNSEPSPVENQVVVTFLVDGNESWCFLEK
jgi:hypothetical protein